MGRREVDVPKDIFIRSSNYAEKNGYLKILNGRVWEMIDMGRDLTAL